MFFKKSYTVFGHFRLFQSFTFQSIDFYTLQLRIPWTARRSNQSISPEYLLEELMLKLKLQYFGHLMRRTDSLEKTLMLRAGDGEAWCAAVHGGHKESDVTE